MDKFRSLYSNHSLHSYNLITKLAKLSSWIANRYKIISDNWKKVIAAKKIQLKHYLKKKLIAAKQRSLQKKRIKNPKRKKKSHPFNLREYIYKETMVEYSAVNFIATKIEQGQDLGMLSKGFGNIHNQISYVHNVYREIISNRENINNMSNLSWAERVSRSKNCFQQSLGL